MSNDKMANYKILNALYEEYCFRNDENFKRKTKEQWDAIATDILIEIYIMRIAALKKEADQD